MLVCGLGRTRAQGRYPAISAEVEPSATRNVAARDLIARDVDGHAVRLMPTADGRVVVLVFVASDCPISNRYLPQLVRLRQAVTAQKGTFWFVYPNLTETAAAIRAHQATFGATGDVLRDQDQRLARLTGAKVTPEAAVLVRHGAEMRVGYTGRIWLLAGAAAFLGGLAAVSRERVEAFEAMGRERHARGRHEGGTVGAGVCERVDAGAAGSGAGGGLADAGAG